MGNLTEQQAIEVIERQRMSRKEKDAFIKRWKAGDMNARFAAMALHKQSK